MKAGLALSKTEFVERVASWATEHNVRFDEGRLDEWMKQALIPAGERRGNEGLSPTYIYGCRHYRRALQLVRFYSQGIRDTDEIIIQLFIRGYGAGPDAVRKALQKEFNKARAKLNAPLRSKFADNTGKMRKRQFLGQLGELDERFRKAEIVIPEDDLIAAVRAARSPDDLESERRKGHDLLWSFFNSFVHGMLEIGDDEKTRLERLILSSSDTEYEIAKMIFKIGFDNSAIETREWTALNLAAALKLVPILMGLID
jgi:hypothetical protein